VFPAVKEFIRGHEFTSPEAVLNRSLQCPKMGSALLPDNAQNVSIHTMTEYNCWNEDIVRLFTS
jgi:hypothetical protein